VPPATPLCHNMQAAAGRNRCVTKTTPSPIDGSISLDDFSNFQYMLARPFVAKAIVNQITSFVFYNEPYNERKAELDHHVLCRGRITLINYYCCCLAVLPSHLLGMSRWIRRWMKLKTQVISNQEKQCVDFDTPITAVGCK
jgi:hypothetical protein